LAEHFDVKAITSILVADAWTGYAPEPPPVFTYRLARASDGSLGGEARLVFPGEPSNAKKLSREVRLSAKVTDELLSRISRIPLRRGTCSPKEWVTDDYPDLRMLFHAENATTGIFNVAVLYLRSDDGAVMPWRVFVDGDIFYTEGNDIERIARAIDRLVGRRQLERERTKRLTDAL